MLFPSLKFSLPIIFTFKLFKKLVKDEKFFDYITSEEVNEIISGAGVVPAN